MTKDALLEIGSEELPAAFIKLGMDQLKSLAESSLKEHSLPHESISVYGTPRRLAVVVMGLPDRSLEQRKTIPGPPASKAKDPAGTWTQAAVGFANKHGLEPQDLVVENDRLSAVMNIKGTATKQLLAQLFPQWIGLCQFPKTMSWEESHFRYPRPIRWITALYGHDLVRFQIAGVTSGKVTHGLGIQSSKHIAIAQPAKYAGLLKNQCVMVEPATRQDAIRRLADQAVKRAHGQVLLSESLLEHVSNLVEHPVAVLGSFDARYLDLPSEVLTTCLEHHQKFFPVIQGTGRPPKLMAHFIGIRNGMSLHQEIVREGYERVLAARLADARFFYNQDRKTKLEVKAEALKGVMFQEKLGNLFEKKERVKGLLSYLASTLKAPWLQEAERAADLCKADLVTDMVREFPELQGTMARIYALADGESKILAEALEEHYRPVTLSGPLPTSEIAAAVALCDKIDTLAGDFAVGLIPSGSADPYGLRRAAVGVLRILEARSWPVQLEDLIEKAVALLPASAAGSGTVSKLVEFMRQRLGAILEERHYKSDEFDAITFGGVGLIHQTVSRLDALHQIRGQGQFDALAAAFKRASNILRQARPKGFEISADWIGVMGVKEETLKEASEQALFVKVRDIQEPVLTQFEAGSTREALELLSTLRVPLDQFFEGVMVMVEDKVVCANRLALLGGIVNLFHKVADFSKLQNA